jgi:hypothetical protein
LWEFREELVKSSKLGSRLVDLRDDLTISAIPEEFRKRN